MSRSLGLWLPFTFFCLTSLDVAVTFPYQGEEGPKIIVVSPHEGDTVKAPFNLNVQFLASPDAQIVPGTLRVEVKKLTWQIDVTEHIKPFANAAGIQINKADFPKGHHTVTLQVADERGRVAAKTVTMDVQ